ncbi:MAG: restriction endonuclease subunit S [Bacteroidota bacterium]
MNVSASGKLDLADLRYVPADAGDRRLRKGDILFNNTNSPVLVGKTAWIGKEADLAFSNHMTRVRCRSEIVDSKWIGAFLHHLFESGYYRMNCTNHVNQASINTKFLANQIRVPVPPLAEQRRIVDALEAHFADLDAGVEALEAARRDLGRYRRSVLKAAVEGALTSGWRRRQPSAGDASALLARILEERRERWEAEQLQKYEAKGKTPPKKWRQRYKPPAEPETDGLPELPPGWAWASVDQLLASFSNGTSAKPTQDEGTAVLRISAVREGRVDVSDVRFLPSDFEQADKYSVGEGELLFTRYNGNPDYVGVCGRVPSLARQILHPDKLIRGVPLPSVESRFLESALNTGESRRFVRDRVRTTAGQAGISQGDVLKAPVPLPPLEEQATIVEAVDEKLSVAEAVAAEVDRQLARAERLRRSLLARAFAGRLVPQDPADEPASALLARLRGKPPAEATPADADRQRAGVQGTLKL